MGCSRCATGLFAEVIVGPANGGLGPHYNSDCQCR